MIRHRLPYIVDCESKIELADGTMFFSVIAFAIFGSIWKWKRSFNVDSAFCCHFRFFVIYCYTCNAKRQALFLFHLFYDLVMDFVSHEVRHTIFCAVFTLMQSK